MFKDLSSRIQIIYRKVKLGASLVNQIATDKPKVLGYLPPTTVDDRPTVVDVPPAVYNHLLAFKEQRGLQSIEMAVPIILSEYFGRLQTPVVAATDATASRLESLEAKCTSLNQTVVELTEAIAALQTTDSSSVAQSEVPTAPQEPSIQPTASNPPVDQSEVLDQAEPLAQSTDSSSLVDESEPLEIPSVSSMTQVALAKRLGVTTSSISRMQSKQNFPEWSKNKDPEGIAWVRSSDTKQFYPQINK